MNRAIKTTPAALYGPGLLDQHADDLDAVAAALSEGVAFGLRMSKAHPDAYPADRLAMIERQAEACAAGARICRELAKRGGTVPWPI